MTEKDLKDLKEGDRILCIRGKKYAGVVENHHLTYGKLYTFKKPYLDTVLISDCDKGPTCTRCNYDGWNAERFAFAYTDEEIQNAKQFDPSVLDVSGLNFKVNHADA